ASAGTLDAQLGYSLRKRRRSSRRDRTVLVAVLVGFLAIIVGGYYGVRLGARAAVKALPTSVDRQVGSTAFETMDLGGPEVKNEVVVGAMQTIVDRLKPHAAIDGMEFEVHVVESGIVNAFALPGGKIVIFTGLIKNAESADQVAAVLGHEMSHATLRHGIERMGQSMGIYAAVTVLVGDAGGLIAMGADLFQVATINSYSRDQENAADEEGVRMLHSAGIDPSAMAKFFQLLEKEHGELPGAFAWISTHPDHASRIENVETMVAALPPQQYQPLEIDWPNVQAQLQIKDQNQRGDN
ncbi:MAG: M48 family metallopeptidase, partial [Planctomycetales bacterium]|nr:M48 family metallopeptidase [Planctomycetales bacterium]